MSKGPRVLMVEGRFYEDIAEGLATGAAAVLEAAGVIYERQAVPGAFEVPAAIGLAVRAMDAGLMEHPFAGFIALGCVIRGETDHYEHICRETSRALMDLTVTHGIALGFGVLTCPTYDHARERADPDRRNKGAEAATACLQMMALRQRLRLYAP